MPPRGLSRIEVPFGTNEFSSGITVDRKVALMALSYGRPCFASNPDIPQQTAGRTLS
jgi:hypothetical protein